MKIAESRSDPSDVSDVTSSADDTSALSRVDETSSPRPSPRSHTERHNNNTNTKKTTKPRSSHLQRHASARGVAKNGENFASPEADSDGGLRMCDVQQDGGGGSARRRQVRRHHSERQRLAREDCCAYCDVHCRDRLSPWRRGSIQAWSEGVTAGNQSDSARLAYITRQRSWKEQEAAKRKFIQNFQPPGEPDLDDGFRVIPTPMSIRSHPNSASSRQSRDSRRPPSSRQTITHADDENDLARKSTNRRRSALSKQRDVLRDQLNYLGMKDRLQNCSENAYQGSLKSESGRFEPPPSSLVKRASSGTTRIKDATPKPDARAQSAKSFVSTSSQPLEKDGLRSSSNIILNVYTIDDALRQVGHGTLQDQALQSIVDSQNSVRADAESGYASTSIATEKSPTISRTTTPSKESSPAPGSRLNSAKHQHVQHNTMSSIREEGGGGESKPPSPTQSSKEGHTCCQHNAAVKTAFRTIANAKTAIYDKQLYRGLIEERPTSKHDPKPVSDKFQRMNNNLRDAMEYHYLHGSGLSRKIDKWHGRSNCNTPTSKSQASSSLNSKTSRQNKPLSPACQGQMSETESVVDYQSKPHSGSYGNAEHFLEMLMDIDSNEPVNIQTFLYV